MINGKAHRHGIDGGASLDRPNPTASVRCKGFADAAAFSLKHQVAGGREHAAVGWQWLRHGPSGGLGDGVPRNQPASGLVHVASRIWDVVVRRDVDQAGARVVAHGPPVVSARGSLAAGWSL